MEVFWIAGDGSVWDESWYDVPPRRWQPHRLAGPGSASTTGGIAAVSRIPGSMEVWWVAPDGSVQGDKWGLSHPVSP
jgi:hypothetical protein